MSIRGIALIAVTAAAVAGCATTAGQPAQSSVSDLPVRYARVLDAKTIGPDWPLTVDLVTLICIHLGMYPGDRVSQDAVLVVSPDGTKYAVNGTALDTKQWPPVNEIWADRDPAASPDDWEFGLKKDISPVLDAGLDLCENGGN